MCTFVDLTVFLSTFRDFSFCVVRECHDGDQLHGTLVLNGLVLLCALLFLLPGNQIRRAATEPSAKCSNKSVKTFMSDTCATE